MTAYPFFHKFLRRQDGRCKLCGQTAAAGTHA